MILKRCLLNICLLSGVFFVACSDTHQKIQLTTPPQADVELRNQEFLDITAPLGWNTFKTSDTLALLVTNISGEKIVSSQDMYVRIFILAGNEWVEVDNQMTYGSEELVLEPNQDMDPFKTTALVILPDLPDAGSSYLVRVVVFGSTSEFKNKEKNVADFIEVNLSP